MSLSKHALTFLKRHYHALLQRAYVLGLAATAERRFTLIPAPHSAQPAPAYRRRSKLTVPFLAALTALSCGPGLDTAIARTTLSGNTISSGTYKEGLEIKSPGNYTVANGTTFQGIKKEDDDIGALYLSLSVNTGDCGLTFAGAAEFLGNYASIDGGAIYTRENLTITGGSGNITFSGNSASIYGGAIYAPGNLTITGGSGNITFSGNSARNNGGAIYTKGNLTTIEGGAGKISFSGNHSNSGGGAIYSCNGSINIRAGTGGIEFVNNRADSNGGAIYTDSVANITLTAAEGNITFSGNTAGSSQASNSIYIHNYNGANVHLQATDGHYVSFADAISGSSPTGINVNLNQGDDYDGAIKFSTSMTLGQVTQHNGTFELSGTGTTLTVTESFTHTDGTIVLKPKAAFTVAKGDYISPKYGSPTTALELSSGSEFKVSSGSYTLSDGATVKVSGLGSSIKAQTIALNSNSTLHFTLDPSVYGNEPDNAMLSLNQTAANATAISLKDVTVTVDSDTSTAAKQRSARTGTTETVHLLHSNKGFTDIPSDSAANNLYQVKVTNGETYRYGEDTTTDPDPDTGGTDPGQGGTNPGEGTTPPGSGGVGSGGDSLVAVRDPQGLARLGATGNQAQAFTILENGTFAADSPEERYFKAKGGIFEVTQQDGTAGLNALTALLPNDAPVVLDQARHTMSFITQAAFDSTELPQARLSATARGAVQDDGGRISAPLSLNSALWLKARLNNLESERYDSGVAGYEGDLSVLALGIDTALTDKWLLGLGFSYSKGDLDALSRSVESEGYSLFTYGRYRSGNWYVNGLVAVSLEDYDEDSQVLTQRTTADYRATTLYGGIFTGLELSTAHGGTFSPELGLTVLSTKLSDYDSDFSSDIEAERATISSALAGFKWQLQAISTEAAELTLQGSLHARYDLSTAGVDYTVGLSNGTQLQLTGEEPDRFAVMPSLGVSLKLGQSRALELEARYSAELSEHFTGQAVSLGLSYRF